KLDARGGKKMSRITSDAVGRRMAVIYVERKNREGAEAASATGEQAAPRTYIEKKIISLATIQTTLGSDFRITGLDSVAEARELALLLRSGALAAPIYFVEERTIGPSLGQQNIDAGVKSTIIGFIGVVIW